MDAAESAQEVLVRFTTPFAALRVPAAPLAVPAELNRNGLSQVIHHLLGVEGSGTAPLFEFYVAPDAGLAQPAARTLLRGSLKKFLRAQGLSAESTLTLEYAPALQPPTSAPEPPRADDWISAVAGSECIVAAGLYNGLVQLHTAAGLRAGGGRAAAPPPVTLHAHAGAVSAAHALDLDSGGASTAAARSSGGSALLVTGGRDGLARLWRADAGPAGALTASAIATLAGAQDAVTSVAIDPTGRLVAAGDGRGGLYLWSAAASLPLEGGAAQPPAAAPKSSKRPRTAAAASDEVGAGVGAGGATRQPLLALPGAHSGMGPVTGVAWAGDGATLVTCGWGDASSRVWAITGEQAAAAEGGGGEGGGARLAATLVRLLPMPASQAPHALAASPSGSQFATAHGDGCVRVWRTSESAHEAAAGAAGTTRGSGPRAVLTLPAPPPAAGASAAAAASSPASTWVSALAWCPASGHFLAGCGHNGSVVLWDTRAPPAPLHVLHAHAAGGAGGGQQPRAKALGLSWAGAHAAAAAPPLAEGAAAPPVGKAQLPGALDGLLVVSGGADNMLRTSRFG